MNININTQSTIAFLRGKKTILIAGVALLYFVGVNHGWWPHETDIDGALAFLGIASGRAALQKVEDALGPDPATAAAPAPTNVPAIPKP